MSMIKTLRLSIILGAVMLASACTQTNSYEGRRTEAERRLYHALSDSMQQLKPSALASIEEQMRTAEDSLTWYDYYLMYGRHYLLTEHLDSLLPYVESTLNFVNQQQKQTPRTKGLAAMAISSKASYHYMLRQHPDSIISLYRQAIGLLAESDLEENLPDMSANLGDAYVQKGDLAEASRWYRRAILLVDSLNLPNDQNLTLYMGLGRIYTTLRDFEQAREFYEATDRKFSQMKPNMQSYFLNNYGNYFYFHREYDKALHTFKRLQALLEKYYGDEDYFDKYLCKINMADVYLNLGQVDSARTYVNEAEEYFERMQVDAAVYYAHTIRIGIAMKEKNYTEVEHILEKEQLQQGQDHDLSGIRNQYLNKYYAAVGNYKQAYDKLEENIAKTDSIDVGLAHMRSSDIMTRLTEDTIRLHHQLEIKEKEAVYSRTRTAFYFILGTLIIIVLLFLIWLNHERKRHLQDKLDMLMLRMSNARQRISPHFVFNVLNSRMAKTDQHETDQLVALAQLIRSNLDMTSRNSVSLAEELDFIQEYIKLERQLIGEDFECCINVPAREVLETIQIPPMLLQIITENAIIHGLKETEGEKRLCINITTNEKETLIEVADNGPGFDIRHISSERIRTGMNIIRNTLNAINQKNNREKMHLNIYNDHGCHVTLTIPRNIKLT